MRTAGQIMVGGRSREQWTALILRFTLTLPDHEVLSILMAAGIPSTFCRKVRRAGLGRLPEQGIMLKVIKAINTLSTLAILWTEGAFWGLFLESCL